MYDEGMKPKLKQKKDKVFPKKFTMPKFSFSFPSSNVFKKIGILLLAVFAFIFITTKISQSGNKKILDKNLETMKTGAYKYFKENSRPEEVNEEYQVSLKELIDSDVMEPLKDKKGNVCDTEASNVILKKKSSTKYSLTASISCDSEAKEKDFSLTYANQSTNNNGTTTYYKLQKEVNVDHYTYSCPDGYILNGTYCYSNATTLTATPIAKYTTTPAKTSKASYKKPTDEYEYVEPVEEVLESNYYCSDSRATLVGDKCILTKEPTWKEDKIYSCNEGVLDGKSCVIEVPAIKKDYKYTCPSGKLIGEDQCELKRNYRSSYACPSDYPSRDGDRCYYTSRAEKDWGEWHYSSRQTFSKEMNDTDSVMYEFVESYESSGGRTKYVYKKYTRTKEYYCEDSDTEDVELRGSRCYYYTSAFEDKICPSGYSLSEDEMECVRYVEATKKKTSTTYSCPEGYRKRGSGKDSECYKSVDAIEKIDRIPSCSSGYTSVLNDNGSYTCQKETNAKKTTETTQYICPTGYEQKGSGKYTKCYKKTTLEGYYYCKNSKAHLEGTECIVDATSTFKGYQCPSGYQLSGNQCVKSISGDKVKATKTNNPEIKFTYKWSKKKSETGWTWTGESEEK